MDYIYNFIVPSLPPTYRCPQNESIWLVYTSLLFIIPAIYSYYKSFFFYSILFILSTIISISYWINPICGWRRNLDHIYAKLFFILFLFHNIFRINILSFILIVGGIYCFYMSNRTYNTLNTISWHTYHMLFHILITITILLLLYEY
jgi:hypothetical protein